MTTKLFTLAVCLLLATHGFCQQFEVPANVVLNAKEDYAKYEKDIIAASDWLEATPLGTDVDKRKDVTTFVIAWITGSPNVSIVLNGLAAKLSEKNPDLLGMFMASYSKHVLSTHGTTAINCYIAGVKSVVALYKLGGKVKKNKFVAEAVQASDAGKLEDWVKDNMNKG